MRIHLRRLYFGDWGLGGGGGGGRGLKRNVLLGGKNEKNVVYLVIIQLYGINTNSTGKTFSK